MVNFQLLDAVRVILVVDWREGLLAAAAAAELLQTAGCWHAVHCYARMPDAGWDWVLDVVQCWLLVAAHAALLMAETCADDAQLFCWQRGHERVAIVNMVCCTLLVACNSSPTALRSTCQTCSVGMNEVTMEAMRERIIGAVSPYVEIESPELVEVRAAARCSTFKRQFFLPPGGQFTRLGCSLQQPPCLCCCWMRY